MTFLNSDRTTAWSDLPKGEVTLVVTGERNEEITKSNVLSPRVGSWTCCVRRCAAQVSSRASPAAVAGEDVVEVVDQRYVAGTARARPVHRSQNDLLTSSKPNRYPQDFVLRG